MLRVSRRVLAHKSTAPDRHNQRAARRKEGSVMMGETTLVPILFEPLLASAALIAIYWIALVVGGGMLVLSVLSGDAGDADFDVGADFDLDLDPDADVDFDAADAAVAPHAAPAHATALSQWFSTQFIVFFLAMFGATGVIVTIVTDAGPGTTLAIALVCGAVIGQGAHRIFNYVRASSGNTLTRPQDYVHKLARVTIPIRGAHTGEIALQVRDAERHVPAVAGGSQADFDKGDEVLVVGYRGGVSSVISRAEAEQQRQSRARNGAAT